MKNETTTNPFEFNATSTENGARKLEHTVQLIGLADSRATELMTGLKDKHPELIDLANTMMIDGERDDLVELINLYFGAEAIVSDAHSVLDDADDEELARLLESRRSDRSKAKKKGIKSNVVACKTYISAMYAELMIREITGKPLAESNNTEDLDMDKYAEDKDALTKKIKSLQTKKCRLAKLAGYDETARAELEMVEADIARLNALRPTTRVVSKTAIQSIPLDTLREALSKLDPESIPEELRALVK